MATVPIEIVLQDAETPVDPTPTPESGEETNIVVPNTGTISNDGSNNGGIGSSISIILPIVIIVLALGAMVALLVRRQQKRKSNSRASISKKEKLATAVSGTIAILAATVLVGNLVIPVTSAATDDTSNDNSSEEGTYLETEDKITITATIGKDSEEDTYTVSTKDILYATTDASGYTVTMSMIEGALTSNLYLDGDETSEYYIAPVEVNEANVEEGVELTANTWGYALDQEAEEYSAVPLADTPATIKEGEEAVTHEEIDVYYTVKVDKELPLGTYSGTIEYNITPVNPIDKLAYMQDFASFSEEDKTKLLASMPEGEQYILKDKRDEKPYFISKLADGNVWMTQNLDLDLGSQTALTPENTNISANWTPANSTISFTGTSVSGWSNSNTTPYSADPGDVYYYTSGTNDNDTQYNSLAECEAVHNDGTCQHYHAGNYYNWSAAVASNDTSGMTTPYENAPDSICPAGWRLPKNANAESYIEGNEQITVIASYYGILGERQSGPPGGMYDYLEGGFNAIRTNPLWLVRSGDVYGGSLHDAADRGSYWPSTVKDGRTYKIDFYSSYVIPADSNSRDIGYSVRCIVR